MTKNEVEDGRLVRPDRSIKKVQGLATPGDKGTWSHHYSQDAKRVLLWFHHSLLRQIAFCRQGDGLRQTNIDIPVWKWDERKEMALVAAVVESIRQAERVTDYDAVVLALVEKAVYDWGKAQERIDAQE